MNMVSAALLLLPLLAYSLPLLSSTIDPSNPDFQYVGRWDFNNASAPAFQWAGSSISFTLQCKAASTMSASFDTHESYIKFAVYQNGETPSNYHRAPGLRDFFTKTLKPGSFSSMRNKIMNIKTG